MGFAAELAFLSASTKAFSQINCIGIPANDPDPAVQVCEDDEAYSFRIEGTTTRYPKDAYRDRIRELLRSYAESIGMPKDTFAESDVTFWLSVPEAAPADAWARVVVAARHHHFLVSLPIDLKPDVVTSAMVANLSTKDYPDYLGHRVGNILVKKAPKSSDDEFHKAMNRAGARGWGDSAGGWTSFFTKEFTELAVIQNILRDPSVKIHVANAQVNEIFEWIAWRAPVFKFNFDAQ